MMNENMVIPVEMAETVLHKIKQETIRQGGESAELIVGAINVALRAIENEKQSIADVINKLGNISWEDDDDEL